MELTASMFLIVLPLVFLASCVDAISGGGGLISLPAYTMAGLDFDLASGNNKLSSTFGTLMATVRYYRGGKLLVAPALMAALMAAPGSVLGTRAAMALGSDAMNAFMIVAIPIVGVLCSSAGTSARLPAPARAATSSSVCPSDSPWASTTASSAPAPAPF